MHRKDMAFQVMLSSECLFTIFTLVWMVFIRCDVCFGVHPQRRFSFIHFVTLVTFVRHRTLMGNDLMMVEVCFAWKCLPTISAFVRFLTSMTSKVVLQGWTWCVRHLTHCALIQFYTSVILHVIFQIASANETGITLSTFKGLIPCMNSCMDVQRIFCCVRW